MVEEPLNFFEVSDKAEALNSEPRTICNTKPGNVDPKHQETWTTSLESQLNKPLVLPFRGLSAAMATAALRLGLRDLSCRDVFVQRKTVEARLRKSTFPKTNMEPIFQPSSAVWCRTFLNSASSRRPRQSPHRKV